MYGVRIEDLDLNANYSYILCHTKKTWITLRLELARSNAEVVISDGINRTDCPTGPQMQSFDPVLYSLNFLSQPQTQARVGSTNAFYGNREISPQGGQSAEIAGPTSSAIPSDQIPTRAETIKLIESYHNRVVKRSGGSIVSGSVEIEKVAANEVWGTINLTRGDADRTLTEGFLARFSSGQISCYLLRDLSNSGKPAKECAPASPTDAQAEVEFQTYLQSNPTKAMRDQASAKRLSGAFLNKEDLACLKSKDESYYEYEKTSECLSGTRSGSQNNPMFTCDVYATESVQRTRSFEINACSRPITFRYGCGTRGFMKHQVTTVKPGEKYYPEFGPPFCFREYP